MLCYVSCVNNQVISNTNIDSFDYVVNLCDKKIMSSLSLILSLSDPYNRDNILNQKLIALFSTFCVKNYRNPLVNYKLENYLLVFLISVYQKLLITVVFI